MTTRSSKFYLGLAKKGDRQLGHTVSFDKPVLFENADATAPDGEPLRDPSQHLLQGVFMTEEDRVLARAALLEGMLAAFYATEHEGNDVGSDMDTMVDAAVASLEASGFTIVRKQQ